MDPEIERRAGDAIRRRMAQNAPPTAGFKVDCGVCGDPIVIERDADQIADAIAAAVSFGRAEEWPFGIVTSVKRWRHAHCPIPDGGAAQAPRAA